MLRASQWDRSRRVTLAWTPEVGLLGVVTTRLEAGACLQAPGPWGHSGLLTALPGQEWHCPPAPSLPSPFPLLERQKGCSPGSQTPQPEAQDPCSHRVGRDAPPASHQDPRPARHQSEAGTWGTKARVPQLQRAWRPEASGSGHLAPHSQEVGGPFVLPQQCGGWGVGLRPTAPASPGHPESLPGLPAPRLADPQE